MLKRKRRKPVPTVFQTYYRRQRLNTMIRNLYVIVPGPGLLLGQARRKLNELSAYCLKLLLKKNAGPQRKIALVDLSALNDTLALHLKGQRKYMIRIPEAGLAFGKLNLDRILKQQSRLLRALIAEQQAELREQAGKILEQEKENMQQKYNNHNDQKSTAI